MQINVRKGSQKLCLLLFVLGSSVLKPDVDLLVSQTGFSSELFPAGGLEILVDGIVPLKEVPDSPAVSAPVGAGGPYALPLPLPPPLLRRTRCTCVASIVRFKAQEGRLRDVGVTSGGVRVGAWLVGRVNVMRRMAVAVA